MLSNEICASVPIVLRILKFNLWNLLPPFSGLQSNNHINRVVSHPTLPVTITAHEDRHIKFFDNKTGKEIKIKCLGNWFPFLLLLYFVQPELQIATGFVWETYKFSYIQNVSLISTLICHPQTIGCKNPDYCLIGNLKTVSFTGPLNFILFFNLF